MPTPLECVASHLTGSSTEEKVVGIVIPEAGGWQMFSVSVREK